MDIAFKISCSHMMTNDTLCFSTMKNLPSTFSICLRKMNTKHLDEQKNSITTKTCNFWNWSSDGKKECHPLNSCKIIYFMCLIIIVKFRYQRRYHFSKCQNHYVICNYITCFTIWRICNHTGDWNGKYWERWELSNK